MSTICYVYPDAAQERHVPVFQQILILTILVLIAVGFLVIVISGNYISIHRTSITPIPVPVATPLPIEPQPSPSTTPAPRSGIGSQPAVVPIPVPTPPQP